MTNELKLKMTVQDALEFADEWSRGMTLHEGSQGWRVVCLLLAAELRRLDAENAQLRAELEAIYSTEPVLSVETEPDFWDRGHFHEGYKAYVDPTKVWGMTIGTKLIPLPVRKS